MGRKSKRFDKVARERIDILMELAESTFNDDRSLAHRYAGLSKKIAMRHAMSLPDRWKRRICKKCGAFLKPGANCKVRTYQGAVNVLCLDCGTRVRIPFTREKRLIRHEKSLLKGKEKDPL